jgi:hypothetical protein
MGNGTTFKTSEEVRRSGVYRVLYNEHPILDIRLLKAECLSHLSAMLISDPIHLDLGPFKSNQQEESTLPFRSIHSAFKRESMESFTDVIKRRGGGPVVLV